MEMFNRSPIGILMYSEDGKLLDANQSALEITGNLEEDSDLDIFCSEFMAQKKETLAEEGSVRFQAPLNFENMKNKAFEKSGEILIDWNISVLDSGFLVQIQEVTEKTSEESIKENERYRRWFEEDLTGDFIATLDGRVLDCNPAFAEIYGFNNLEQAVEADISNFNRPDWETLIKRIKLERKVQGHQSTHRRPDGRNIHIVANVVGIFDDSGELVQVKGYVFNDTERKQAEEKLANAQNQIKEILDSIKDGFVALNSYWNFIYVNQAAGEYFGAEPEDIIGENIWESFPELLGTKYEKTLRRAMDEQETQYFEDSDINETGPCFGFSVYPSLEGISIYWRKNNLEI
jgi:PAS domain S-box-containing protein